MHFHAINCPSSTDFISLFIFFLSSLHYELVTCVYIVDIVDIVLSGFGRVGRVSSSSHPQIQDRNLASAD